MSATGTSSSAGTNSVSQTPESAGLWSMKCMTAPPTPRIAGMASSPGPMRLLEGLGAERGGALDGGGGVLDAEADVADADAVGQVGGVGEALALGVDDEIDAALAVEGHVLGDVAAGLGGSPCRGRSAPARARSRSWRRTRRTRRRKPRCGRASAAMQPDAGLGALDLVHQGDERAVAVDGDRARRAAAELVVEDLEARASRRSRWRRRRRGSRLTGRSPSPGMLR